MLRGATRRWLSATSVDGENLIAKVVGFVKKKKEAGNVEGALKIGKEYCGAFNVPHPKIKTAKGYYTLLERVAVESEKIIEARRPKRQDTMKLWESDFSCFTRTPAIHEHNDAIREKLKNFLVLDFETTTITKHKRKASPFEPDNRVVYTAWGNSEVKSQVDGPFTTRTSYQQEFPSLKEINVIVGHNIKFDLLYIWDFEELKAFFCRGGLIWDTMYVEYILNGHKDIGGLSLDNLSLLYGGELKDNFIKQQWDMGIDTPDIDPVRMRDYAAADVENTRLIFEAQLGILHDGCRLPLVQAHMEGLLATTEMEYNGLFVDTKTCDDMQAALNSVIQQSEEELIGTFVPYEVESLNKKNDLKVPITFNWASASQLRAYLFGGSVNYKGHVMDPVKKKYVPTTFPVVYEGIVPAEWKEKYSQKFQTKEGAWKVTDDVVSSIADNYSEEKWAQAIDKLRTVKKNKKINNTYLTAFSDLRDQNNIIHPQLNHTFTRTGRLSSSNPNMQNIPRGDKSGIKKCLTTRFYDKSGNPTGKMIESDYSQLEVFVMALLSQDKTLMGELDEGADLHCKRLARMRNMSYEEVVKLCKVDKDPYWSGQRTKAKVFSFQRQYGAGNKMISLTTGLDIEEVKQMAENEKLAYPSVEAYFGRVTDALRETATVMKSKEGFYDGPSGNRWYFEEVEDMKRPSAAGRAQKEFKKQLVLNHPVQGFAAEIVLTVLGRLWRHFISKGNYSASGDFTTPGRALLVNTVHDCVWIDTVAEVEEQVTKDVERILADVKGAYEENGITFPTWVGFKTETTSGLTMADL